MVRDANPAIVVMAKAPVPGKAKTRLHARLGTAGSAELARAMLQDTLALSALTGGGVYVAFTPAGERDTIAYLAGAAMTLIPQRGKDLGARMTKAVSDVLACGYSRVVVIGTDCPALKTEHLCRAIKTLDRSDICIGPTTDGGFYLFGTRGSCRGLFDAVPWGTERVLEAVLDKVHAAGLQFELLPELFDVDIPADLDTLKEWLATAPAYMAAPHHTAVCFNRLLLQTSRRGHND